MDRQQSVRWGRGAAHNDRSRARKAARRGRVARMTATVTATAAANGYQQRPTTTRNTRTIRANLAYARPEKADSRSTAPTENLAYVDPAVAARPGASASRKQ